MTYLGGALAYWVAQFNAVTSTLATRTSERDSARNSLYVSGTYLSGPTWQAQDATDLANYNAEVTLYNNEVTLYNNEVAAFNALQNGLNNPDGITTVSMSWPSLPGNGTSGTTFTLTIPRNGHYLIAVVVDASLSLNSFGDGLDIACSGIINQTKSSSSGWNNSGTMQIGAGFAAHGDYTAGQTVTVSLTTHFVASGSASGTMYAHFVPDASHHN